MITLLLDAESWPPISRDSGVKERETCRPDSFRGVAIWLARNLLSFNMFYNQKPCYVNEVCFYETLYDMKQTYRRLIFIHLRLWKKHGEDTRASEVPY